MHQKSQSDSFEPPVMLKSLSITIDGNWFKMDEVIFEFKGTGNMELQLDRKLLTNVSSLQSI
jgi:hypothetical protein